MLFVCSNTFIFSLYIDIRSTKEKNMNAYIITSIGLSVVFLMNTLGASLVFLFRKDLSGKVNSLFLGFASGLMIASSVWSLLLPAIEQSSSYGDFSFLPASLGIIIGTLFLVIMDKLVPYFLKRNNKRTNFSMSSSTKLFLAVTLHNLPEGLAVGLVFGNAFVVGEISVFYAALWLAIGIGIQNFPEGCAVSFAMKEQLKSNKKAFCYSMLSGLIEPIMAIIGIFLTSLLSSLMPWLLAFAAGAMLFVVAEELLPEAKNSYPNSNVTGWGLIMGFVIMMILDIAFG